MNDRITAGQTPLSNNPAHQSAKKREITHKRGTGQRKWGLGAAETEVADWRLGVRHPQKLVYPIRRRSLERRVFETDNGTSDAFVRNRRGVNTNLQQGGKKNESVDKHP